MNGATVVPVLYHPCLRIFMGSHCWDGLKREAWVPFVCIVCDAGVVEAWYEDDQSQSEQDKACG